MEAKYLSPTKFMEFVNKKYQKVVSVYVGVSTVRMFFNSKYKTHNMKVLFIRITQELANYVQSHTVVDCSSFSPIFDNTMVYLSVSDANVKNIDKSQDYNVIAIGNRMKEAFGNWYNPIEFTDYPKSFEIDQSKEIALKTKYHIDEEVFDIYA
jgi:hypothetical protein